MLTKLRRKLGKQIFRRFRGANGGTELTPEGEKVVSGLRKANRVMEEVGV